MNAAFSIKFLENAREEKDPEYSGPASFFMGHFFFRQEDYSQARKNYEMRIGREKKAWKDREGERRGQERQVIESLRTIASEERTWGNEKKGYELEVKRWPAESERRPKVDEIFHVQFGSQPHRL